MKSMKRLVPLTLISLALLVGGNAWAGHPHRIETPGTCVENAARGQTAIADPDAGGYHRFHDNVHKGRGADDGIMERSGRVAVFVGPC